jgi:Inner membrane protein YgaP-like, transmembrane domain
MPDRLSIAEKGWLAVNIDRAVLMVAGSVLLISLALAWLVSQYWLLLSVFVGLNMVQASFTGFCPAAAILRKLGFKEGPAFPSRAGKA